MKDDVDKVEQLRQEVAKMAQEKKDMQREFEEVLREAAQERQATRPFQLRQFARQETHAGKLTDEDGDKTEREADVRARLAPPARRGTLITNIFSQADTILATPSASRRDKDTTTQKSGGNK